MRKRLTSLLLTLVMLLSLVPAMGVTASAAEPEWTTVNTYKELLDAVNDRKEYIKLGQNIDTTSYNEGIAIAQSASIISPVLPRYSRQIPSLLIKPRIRSPFPWAQTPRSIPMICS